MYVPVTLRYVPEIVGPIRIPVLHSSLDSVKVDYMILHAHVHLVDQKIKTIPEDDVDVVLELSDTRTLICLGCQYQSSDTSQMQQKHHTVALEFSEF